MRRTALRIALPAASSLHFIALSMAISMGHVLGNTLGTALVLSSGGIEQLPSLYMALAVTSVPLAFGLSTLIDRRGPLRLYQWLLAGTALIIGLLWVALKAGVPLAAEGVYMTTKLHEILGDILFWVLVSQYFTSLELKKIATVLGFGFALGGVLTGGLTALLLKVLPAPALLLLMVAVYLVLIQQLALIHRKLEPLGSGAEEEDGEEEKTGLLDMLRSLPTVFRRYPMAFWISIGIFVMIFSYCVIEYLFYAVYVASYPEERELTAFLALMNGVLQAAEMAFIAFIATPLLRRGGPLLRNLFLPVANLLCVGALLMGFRLPAAIASQISGDALNNAVFEPVKAVNFAAVPHRYAGRVRTVSDGVFYPVGLAAAGLALLLLNSLEVSLAGIGSFALFLAAVFVAVGWLTGRAYLPQLVKNLSSGAINFDGHRPLAGNPQEMAAQVGGLLASPDREARLFGLRLAARLGEGVPLEQVVATVLGGDAAIRQAAIHALSAMPLQSQQQFLLSVLAAGEAALPEEQARTMRTVAMGVLLAPRGERTEEMRRHVAEHLDEAVRVTAIAAGLVAIPGSGRGAADDVLAHFMALDPTARGRVLEALSAAATTELGPESSLDASVPLLLALTESPDAPTRIEALRALAQLARPDDAGVLAAALRAMDDALVPVRIAATAVLGSAGEAAVERLGRALGDPARAVRLAAARHLARCGPAGEAIAGSTLRSADPAAVEAATLALGRMATRSAREALFGALQPSYARIAQNRGLQAELATMPTTPLTRALQVGLADSDRRALERVMQVLDALSRDRTVRHLRHALEAGDRRSRADAVEALASLPERRFVTPLLPFLSALAAAEPPAVGGPGTRATAQALRELARQAAADEDRWIGRTGRWLLAKLDGVTAGQEYLDMDRLLFLKSVPLFNDMPFDALLALNAAMIPIDYLAGETIIADGSVGHSMFLVTGGRLEVRKGGRRLAELGPTVCFGEMALIDAAPRAADVVAISDCSLLRMSRAGFESLTDEHPRVLAELCRVFVRRLRSAQAVAAAPPSAPAAGAAQPA
jgi:hypothetical protein